MLPKHRLTAGTLVRNENNDILLVKHPERGWELPGGHVEEGESITNALKREVMEESGVEIEIGHFCGISQDVNKAICHTWWLAMAKTSELKTSEESIQVKFVKEEDAITMITREDFKKAVIGHSFGGYLALLYASAYPNSITNVVFECPTFDFAWTAKSLLRRAASVFLKQGAEKKSEECLNLAASNLPSKCLFDWYLRLGEELGEHKEDIYRVNADTSIDYSAYTDEEWEAFDDRTDIHLERLREEGRIFQSIVSLLPSLSIPSLLVMGDADPVTCDKHVEAYNQMANGHKVVINNCGHTPHAECPDVYYRIVSAFLLQDEWRFVEMGNGLYTYFNKDVSK